MNKSNTYNTHVSTQFANCSATCLPIVVPDRLLRPLLPHRVTVCKRFRGDVANKNQNTHMHTEESDVEQREIRPHQIPGLASNVRTIRQNVTMDYWSHRSFIIPTHANGSIANDHGDFDWRHVAVALLTLRRIAAMDDQSYVYFKIARLHV